MWTERELRYIEHLRYRIRCMEAEGYSQEEIYASISFLESRFLNPQGQMHWRQARTQNKQNGRIFALRNNPKALGISRNWR
jgi:hypothetical protein